jgi:hypothetical protein
MKKLFFLIIISVAFTACKKTEFEPKGPTDVRVKNITDVTFNEVIVKIDEEVGTLGTVLPGEYSDYHRFETAYSFAEISARIDGVLFSTGPVDNTYSHYMGQMKITYVVYIKEWNNKKLEIEETIPEEPLDDLK